MTDPNFPRTRAAGLFVYQACRVTGNTEVIPATEVEALLERQERELLEMLEPLAEKRAASGPVGPGSAFFETKVRPRLEPPSCALFTAADFLNTGEPVHVAANRLLAERGVRVWLSKLSAAPDDAHKYCVYDAKRDGLTHTALLVDVRPIVRDTAESLLRELIEGWATQPKTSALAELCERARALLEDK